MHVVSNNFLCACYTQVERLSRMPNDFLSWQPGDAWKHRRTGYRRIAEKLGGVPLQAYKDIYAKEPLATRHICNDKIDPAIFKRMRAAAS